MSKADSRYNLGSFISIFSTCTLTVALLTSCSCKDERKSASLKDSDDHYVAEVGVPMVGFGPVKTAIAYIHPIKGNTVKGMVTFTKLPEGVKIVADLHGLTPGKHGFHVHEYGDCGGTDAAAAGAHFDVGGHKHGAPDSKERHAGDLGNLEADAKGNAHYERVDTVIDLQGNNSILGRSIIVHADADDFHTQPSGVSGAKIACGIIEVVPNPE